MKKKINTKEDLEKCYINLANKELNGEVTEEVYRRVKKCLSLILQPTHQYGHSFKEEELHKYERPFVIYCGKDYRGRDYMHVGWVEDVCIRDKQEISIFDIAGMEKKYTIEDLKTKKIAVHLPTEKEYDSCVKLLGSMGYMWHSTEDVLGTGMKSQHEINPDFCIKFYKNPKNEVSYSSKGWYVKQGYTIFTLDQLDMGEPKEEEEKIDFQLGEEEHGIVGGYYDLDGFDQVIIKYQGKEKVITKEDFEEKANTVYYNSFFRNEDPRKNLDIENFENGDLFYYSSNNEHKIYKKTPNGAILLENDGFVSDIDVGNKFKEGSRMWAFEMLDRGEKVRHNSWNRKEYIYFDHKPSNGETAATITEQDDDTALNDIWFIDGWELYKEEPKTMSLGKLIKTAKLGGEIKFKFEDEILIFNGYRFTEYKCMNKVECPVDIGWVVDNLDKQVEIIGE